MNAVPKAELTALQAASSSADMMLAAQADATERTCFHCGLPVPPNTSWQVSIGEVARPMCCPGCEAVAQCIVANGFSDYYLTRTEFSGTAGATAFIPPELALYDENEAAGQFDTTDENACDGIFSVDGIRCAACVWLIERRLARLPGVLVVNMNVATERLHVRWARGTCRPSAILQTMREIGYVAYPFDVTKHEAKLERARKTLFRQLFIAGLSMMQVMMYALPVYLANDGTMDADMTNLMRWAGLLLTLPAVGYSALPFFSGAWVNLKNRMPGMDVPVALAIAAAFIGSVVATLRGSGDVYFDSITMFIFLLLGSRYLELTARRKAASALDNLQHALPDSAMRMTGYPGRRDTEMISAAQLREHDIVLVQPGAAIPADGIILEGDTDVDLALLTGESRLQRKTIGANLPGGAVNATQPIVLRVTRSVSNSTLSLLVKLIERAGQGRPQLALWADKVAAWFVAALLLFTVGVFIAWHVVDPSRAWQIAIAVLVVSCPCALSLATPTALAAATDRLVRRGALIVKPHVLETLHRATHIIFDKTGTLTVGKPTLQHVEMFNGTPAVRALRIAGALESFSAHPLAVAMIEAASANDSQAHDVVSVIGQGMEGTVDCVRYRLGSAAFVQSITVSPIPQVSQQVGVESTSIFLGAADGWIARFDFSDALRHDAMDVVKRFQSEGKSVILLSGDQQAVTQRIANELGIKTAYGEHLPDQKPAVVQQLQRDGAIVAMVGDGINDAAVLRAADVSFAMGSGTALAQTSADCVLLSGRLATLGEVDCAASQTISVIRQNLAWATLYNLVAIPAAALGLLNPWMSGIGMSVSSAVVVLNALRLRRKPRTRGSQLEKV